MKKENAGLSRRAFLARGSAALAGAHIALGHREAFARPGAKGGSKLKFGLVTYLWGKDWDVPTLIRNCQKTGLGGVELRTQHAHGVDDHLTPRQRFEVKLRFENSPIVNVGLGTNFAFHDTDQARVQENIEGAKRYVKLSADVGGSGIKVKPNGLPEGIPLEKTYEQIGKALDKVGAYAADFDQEIRVEVHGRKSQELPHMHGIFKYVEQANVGMCWNSNKEDLLGDGLAANFNLVKERFASTAHVRELDAMEYPYQELFNLFVQMDYDGWILMEARGKPMDRIEALQEQRMLFDKLVQTALAQKKS